MGNKLTEHVLLRSPKIVTILYDEIVPKGSNPGVAEFANAIIREIDTIRKENIKRPVNINIPSIDQMFVKPVNASFIAELENWSKCIGDKSECTLYGLPYVTVDMIKSLGNVLAHKARIIYLLRKHTNNAQKEFDNVLNRIMESLQRNLLTIFEMLTASDIVSFGIIGEDNLGEEGAMASMISTTVIHTIMFDHTKHLNNNTFENDSSKFLAINTGDTENMFRVASMISPGTITYVLNQNIFNRLNTTLSRGVIPSVSYDTVTHSKFYSNTDVVSIASMCMGNMFDQNYVGSKTLGHYSGRKFKLTSDAINRIQDNVEVIMEKFVEVITNDPRAGIYKEEPGRAYCIIQYSGIDAAVKTIKQFSESEEGWENDSIDHTIYTTLKETIFDVVKKCVAAYPINNSVFINIGVIVEHVPNGHMFPQGDTMTSGVIPNSLDARITFDRCVDVRMAKIGAAYCNQLNIYSILRHSYECMDAVLELTASTDMFA